MKALDVIADEKAAHCQSFVRSVRHAPNHSKHVNDGQISQKMIGGVVENLTHGIFSAAHDALHPIHCAQIMAAVDSIAASGADENVLVVIGHANHFMGHDLADREDEIKATTRNEPVHLRRPCIVQLAFRLLINKLRRNFAENLDLRSPVVDVEKLLRHGSEHARDLVGLHGGMCAKRRQNRLHPIAVIFPRIAGQFAGARVQAALVRRHGEHAIPLAEFRHAFRQQLFQLREQIGFDTARGAVKAHAVNSTFFSPGASRHKTTSARRYALAAMPKRLA